MGTTTSMRAILVVGMHRSGTSLVAGMLGDLGCRLPSDLMEGAPMNPKGFCESTSITALNDELMGNLGSSWFDWRPLQIDLESAVVQAFAPRAVDATNSVFGRAEYAVLKDPRISRLIPFWEQVLGRSGRETSYVLVYRDPREVLASLDTWAGYDPGYGELLWLRYVLDAEFATRHRPRAFVAYASILSDWTAEAARLEHQLGVTWPRSPQEASRSGAAFVDPTLRRSVPTALECMSPWTRQAMAIFDGWASRGEDSDQRVILDQLRLRLDEASSGFASVVDRGRTADIRARQLTEALKNHESESRRRQVAEGLLAEARTALERATEESAEFRDRYDDSSRELTEAQAGLRQLEQELAKSHAQQELTRGQLSEASLRVEELSAILAEDRITLAATEGALAEARAETASLHTELESVARQRNQLRRIAASQMRDGIAEIMKATRAERDGATPEVDLAVLQVADERLRHRIRDLEQVHQAVLASRSWRITAPLRRFTRVLRRDEVSS